VRYPFWLTALFWCGIVLVLLMVTTISFPGWLVFDPPLWLRLGLGGAAGGAWLSWVYLNRRWHRGHGLVPGAKHAEPGAAADGGGTSAFPDS
jgi:hypothetical protein